MLGPSIMFTGTPVALGGSISAVVVATDRARALVALTLSAFESLGLAMLIAPLFF